jgi:hypothetical protein
MRTRLALILIAGLVTPALADKKLDPDPAFLAKARTNATAKVEAHYDISDKAPFWARFIVCAGQLTAARDEGRALPATRADLEKLIADYRGRAAELQAYRQKADAKVPALDIDAEIAKVRSGAMSYLPADTTRLGVEKMKALHGQRLAFCQLTRDWYEVQNGLRAPTAAADQVVIARATKEAERQTVANAPKPPKPPAIGPMRPALKPSTVQPVARVQTADPLPAVRIAVPTAGFAGGAPDARDMRVGANVAAAVYTDFGLRPIWSALAECSARMDLIESRGGGSTRVQSDGYARRAAYILWGSRGDVGGRDLAAMAGPVAQERTRLAARVTASWDEHRQRTGQLPHAHWGQVCHGLEQYASAEAGRILEAKRAQAQRDHAAAMRRFEESSRQNTAPSSPSGGGYSVPSASTADADRSRAEHQRTMQRYERENRQIKQEIRAIDRKYR